MFRVYPAPKRCQESRAAPWMDMRGLPSRDFLDEGGNIAATAIKEVE
jgi:hypothetical protein